MKIDLITLHYIDHYGSLLQTYATCKTFEKLGHSIEVIDYRRPNVDEKKQLKMAMKVRGYKKGSIKGAVFQIVKKYENKKTYKFSEEFRRKYIPLTKYFKNYEELKKNPPEADAYVTGSDQTWNSEYNGGVLPAYFLDFAPESKTRLGYSVSIGMDRIPEDEIEITKEYINKYKAISVRENSAKRIIEELGYENVTHVLDPTLVLNKKDWKPLISKKSIKEKYILIYKLNNTPEIEAFAQKLSKDTGYKIVRISYYLNHYKFKGKMMLSPSVEEFLSLIYHAEYVITDSFHCLAFSMNFEKEFYVIFPGKYSDRLGSIMDLTKTNDRLVENSDIYTKKTIDYKYVNKVLDEEREKAIHYLKSNLEDI